MVTIAVKHDHGMPRPGNRIEAVKKLGAIPALEMILDPSSLRLSHSRPWIGASVMRHHGLDLSLEVGMEVDCAGVQLLEKLIAVEASGYFVGFLGVFAHDEEKRLPTAILPFLIALEPAFVAKLKVHFIRHISEMLPLALREK